MLKHDSSQAHLRRRRRARLNTSSKKSYSNRVGKLIVFGVAADRFPLSEHPHAGHGRPQTRGECNEKRRDGNGRRSFCPYVSCKHHLKIHVMPNGTLVDVFPDCEVWEMPETCSLDIADRGSNGATDLAPRLNLTPEMFRRVEHIALNKVSSTLAHWRDNESKTHLTIRK